MAEMTSYAPGTFCWVDLATGDPDAAKTFYGELLGWTADDTSAVGYTIFRRGGKQACGLYAMGPELGPDPAWASYIHVEDVEQVAAQALVLGAQLVTEPTTVPSSGRMAVIRDPTGALVGLWQPSGHCGAEIDNQVGARSWAELQTRDLAGAADFYGQLLGWTHRTDPKILEGSYTLFDLDGRPVGGMVEIQDSWGPVQANWAVYFGVADCDGTLAAARRLGGSVVMSPLDVERVGRFAFLSDPQGALFAIIQFSHPV